MGQRQSFCGLRVGVMGRTEDDGPLRVVVRDRQVGVAVLAQATTRLHVLRAGRVRVGEEGREQGYTV
eukprot:COSAG04_NODE_17939_length_455_cov_1.227528_2_plen_67_part_00